MSAIYFFPGDDVPTCYERDAKGVVRDYGGDDTPENFGDVHGMCVFEGTVHRVADLTDEQIDNMGASRDYDEWWQGHFRPATDAEILAVFSHAPTGDERAGVVEVDAHTMLGGAMEQSQAPVRLSLIPVTYYDGHWVWDEHVKIEPKNIPYATAVSYVREDLLNSERARVVVTHDEMAALHHLSDYTHYLSDKASDGFYSLYNRCVVTEEVGRGE